MVGVLEVVEGDRDGERNCFSIMVIIINGGVDKFSKEIKSRIFVVVFKF